MPKRSLPSISILWSVTFWQFRQKSPKENPSIPVPKAESLVAMELASLKIVSLKAVILDSRAVLLVQSKDFLTICFETALITD